MTDENPFAPRWRLVLVRCTEPECFHPIAALVVDVDPNQRPIDDVLATAIWTNADVPHCVHGDRLPDPETFRDRLAAALAAKQPQGHRASDRALITVRI